MAMPPLDPDTLFRACKATDGTADAIREVCLGESVAMLRKAANWVMLPVPDGATASSPSAWRNREATKEQLADALANHLCEVESTSVAGTHYTTTGNGDHGDHEAEDRDDHGDNDDDHCDDHGDHEGESSTEAESGRPEQAETAESEDTIRETCPGCGGNGTHELPYSLDCDEHGHASGGGGEAPGYQGEASPGGEGQAAPAGSAENAAQAAPETWEEDEAPFELPAPPEASSEAPEAVQEPEQPEEDGWPLQEAPETTEEESEGDGWPVVETEAPAEVPEAADPEEAPAAPEMHMDNPPAPGDDLADAIARAIAGKIPANGGAVDDDRIRRIAYEVAEDLDVRISDVLRDWTREQLEAQADHLLETVGTSLREQASTLIANKIDEMAERLSDHVSGLMAAANQVTISVEGRPDIVLTGKQHEAFPALLAMLAARVHVMLVGPSGSGKTHACEMAARALSLPFYCISVGAQTALSQIMGYMDATGRYVRTVFRDAYENGGVFLLDEIDAGNPNVLTALNAALANGQCAFPDGMVAQSPLFHCVAAANTFGNGQDRQYVGRNQLDATSLDRFAIMNWNYDEALEREIAGFPEWVEVVQAYRAAAASINARHIISPRASIYGARLVIQGQIPIEQIVEMTVFKGMEESLRARINGVAAKHGLKAHTLAAVEERGREIRDAQNAAYLQGAA